MPSQRYLQQIKEMYDISSFNADEHLELEQELVSYRQSSKKQWVRSLNGAMQELPEMLGGWGGTRCYLLLDGQLREGRNHRGI